MDSIRRQTLRDLAAGDPAAERVPQVITLDPRRVARTMMQGVLDQRPLLTQDEARAIVLDREPDLRAAFAKFNLTKDDITPLERMTLEREPHAAIQTRRQESTMTSNATQSSTATFRQLAHEEREKNPKLTEHESMALVSRKYPDLYAEVQREGAVDSAGVSLAAYPAGSPTAAQSALRTKPITSPVAKSTPTIEPKKPSSADGPSFDATIKIIETKIADAMRTQPGLSQADAQTKVFDENPGLYKAYRAAQSRRANGLDAQSDDGD